ncbi:hypothetical protein [Flavobacterium stagni]|uniref:SGNH/GDSL hydrolase family protein n=1 Tax=Flavobacterium stagni TaxID=2506421 RepID=A0A4V1N2F7_9FLAO|nr:hypothetical protein [Flavobacterium stagni]RXR21580.1 hypothetical protein EQG61_11245 [Flavobacterium stagni]
MKKFVLFLLKIIGLGIITLIALDALYTSVYTNSSVKRNKISYLYDSKDLHYDVVFLGSSRVNNHFVPEVFNKAGLKSYNFGLTRSRLEESALMLELMIERHYKIKTLILQVDLNINTNDHSEAIRSLFMPYLHQSETIRNYYQTIEEYPYLLYIPFYRYMHYDARTGFREMWKTLKQEPTNQLDNDGFYPLFQNQHPLVPADLKKYSPKRNIAYEKIKRLCAQHGIRLIAMTTPICTETINREYFDQIKKVYPEILNFENAVTEDKYFSTCGHMNKDGAYKFTQVVLDSLFKPQSKLEK